MENSERTLCMRTAALSQAAQAFETCRDEIFFAVKILSILAEEIRRNGILYGSEEGLSAAAEAERRTPILAEYLQYGMDLMADAEFGGLLEDQIYLSGYSGAETYVAYLYLTGLSRIQAGIRGEELIRNLLFLLPLKEHKAYKSYFPQVYDPDTRTIYLREQNDAAFSAFDAEGRKKDLPADAAAAIDLFNQTFSAMENSGIQRILQNVEASWLIAALPYASREVRDRFLENMSRRMQTALREDWLRTNISGIQASEALAAIKMILAAHRD